MRSRRARVFVLALCLFAAARVWFFATAFPFFNPVDEKAHVDLVLKYSQGHWPAGVENYTAESARYFALYGSPEYLLAPADFDENIYPRPNWTLAPDERARLIEQVTAHYTATLNHESGEPPLYYAIAAAWLKLGQTLHLSGLSLLYWIRWFNVVIAAALVYLGYAIGRGVFQDRHLLALGLAAFISIWPQKALYSVQSDALSPLCFGFAFLGFVRLHQAPSPRFWHGAWIGLATAATCLTKTANLPLLVVIGLAVFWQMLRFFRAGQSRPALVALIAFALCAATPVAAWMIYNLRTFGDVTATQAKIDMLTWTAKPFAAWWSHPIFTLHGAKSFMADLLSSFWRGEFVWQKQPMREPWSDTIWWTASLLLFVAACASIFPGTRLDKRGHEVFFVAFLSFAALIGFLILLSIAFDFGSCIYPSRAHPFFTSGRLLNAVAVPFFLLLVRGTDWIARRTTARWIDIVLMGALCLTTLAAQLSLDARAVASPYNLWHAASGAPPI